LRILEKEIGNDQIESKKKTWGGGRNAKRPEFRDRTWQGISANVGVDDAWGVRADERSDDWF